MTWHTPEGDRVLAEHESELVKDSVVSMLEEIASCRETEDQPCEYGVTLFDELIWSQQLALLSRLVNYLLQPTDETLELTGVHEAGVAAIYRNVIQQIEIEIELESVSPDEFRFQWRQLVVNANDESTEGAEVYADASVDDWEIDEKECSIERWESTVDLLADRVLWDRDFEMASEMIDAPPEKAAALRAVMGIEPEYYTAIAPDPTDTEVDELFESMQWLTQAKPR